MIDTQVRVHNQKQVFKNAVDIEGKATFGGNIEIDGSVESVVEEVFLDLPADATIKSHEAWKVGNLVFLHIAFNLGATPLTSGQIIGNIGPSIRPKHAPHMFTVDSFEMTTARPGKILANGDIAAPSLSALVQCEIATWWSI